MLALFLFIFFMEESGPFKLDELYVEQVWAVASNGPNSLISWGDGSFGGKLGVFRFKDESVITISDARIKASIPMIAPFDEGFAIVPFVGTQTFSLITIDGAFQTNLRPEEFLGWTQGMVIKNLFPYRNNSLLLNIAIPEEKEMMVAILDTTNRKISIIHRQPATEYTQYFVPHGQGMLQFTFQTGEIALVDRKTFRGKDIILKGYEPRKKDPKKFKRLARLRPYVNRVSRPYIVGRYLSAAYMVDYDRFGNLSDQIRITNLVLESNSIKMYASSSMILAVSKAQYLLFDSGERELSLKTTLPIKEFSR